MVFAVNKTSGFRQRCAVLCAVGGIVAATVVGGQIPASAAPTNNGFGNAEVLGASGSIVRSNVGASAQANEPSPIAGDASASIWFKWTATTSHRTTIDLIGSDIDTLLSVYDTGGLSASLANLNEVVSDDDGFGCDLTSLVQFDAVAGITYWIQVDSWDPTDTSANLHLQWNNVRGNPPANDDIANAQTVGVVNTAVIQGNNNEATAEENFDDTPSTNTVWYRLAVPANTRVTVTTASASAANVFGRTPNADVNVYSGPSDGLWYEGNVVPNSAAAKVNVITADTVWLEAESMPCAEGAFTLTVTESQGLVTSNYDPTEISLLIGAAGKVHLAPEELQHDAVGVIEFIYGIAGVKGPISITPPAGGITGVTSSWPASDQPVLTSLQTKWAGLTAAETQKVATGVVIFLLSLS